MIFHDTIDLKNRRSAPMHVVVEPWAEELEIPVSEWMRLVFASTEQGNSQVVFHDDEGIDVTGWPGSTFFALPNGISPYAGRTVVDLFKQAARENDSELSDDMIGFINARLDLLQLRLDCSPQWTEQSKVEAQSVALDVAELIDTLPERQPVVVTESICREIFLSGGNFLPLENDWLERLHRLLAERQQTKSDDRRTVTRKDNAARAASRKT